MDILKNKSLLLLIVVFTNSYADGVLTASHTVINKVYGGAVDQLNRAKKTVEDYFSDKVTQSDALVKKITINQAVQLLGDVLDGKPSNKEDIDAYWQSKGAIVLRCAKILCEASTYQILKSLQEIDKRLLYWLYQKDHQWQYFFSKNPIKWVTGKNQDEEINSNINLLRSKQDELYTRLGELSLIDWQDYLVAFNSPDGAYAWVNTLFAIMEKKNIASDLLSSDDYDVIVTQLKDELKMVGFLQESIMMSLSDTAVSHHIMRNWMKYGALLVIGHYLYNQESIVSLLSPENVGGYRDSAVKYWHEEMVPPAKNIINKVFFRSTTDAERTSLQKSLSGLLDKIAPQQKEMIMNAEKVGDLVPLQELFNNMDKAGWRLASKGDVIQTAFLLAELKLNQGAEASSVLRNLLLLMPVYFMTLAGYYGYQKFTQYDYAPIRLALLGISALFVDKEKLLNNYEYGRMMYLLYNLKEKVKNDLRIRVNIRDEFMEDLEKVESRQYDSAAKRRIIKDMFRKYTFLGIVQ